jgi:hypothetical protein
LAELSAGLVTGYVVEYCRGRNTESAKAMWAAPRFSDSYYSCC